jgi:hypothetical protein
MIKKILFPFVIALFACIFSWQLFLPGFFSMHDDLQVMRVYQMDRCFQDGQIPCRFSPDMAYEYGQPMFNYYSAFPYYLGQLIHLVGFSFVDTVKVLFFLSMILSGLFMYFFASQIFDKKVAFLASLSFMSAPYHALDIFVRGAMSEAWGLTLIPAVLASFLYLIEKPKAERAALFALSIFAFTTTHNLTSIIAAPLLFGLGLVFLIQKKIVSSKTYTNIIAGSLLGLGLSAFFILPVAFERNLISQESLISGYFDYHAHFVGFKQLFFKSDWGYGPSRYGTDDQISFYFGLVPSLSLLLSPFLIIKTLKKKQHIRSFFISLFLGITLFYLFLTHFRSFFIWEALPIIHYTQFPWRFLGPAIFTGSILVGLSVLLFKDKKQSLFIIFLVSVLIFSNFNYFKFEKHFPNVNDANKLSGESYNDQISAAISDYLPKTASEIPLSKAPNTPYSDSGSINMEYFDKRSNYFSTEFVVLNEQAEVIVPIMYFPGWEIYLNHSLSPVQINIKEPLGLISLTLPQGHHHIQGWFENTKIRNIANLTTSGSALILLLWLGIERVKENSSK